MGKSDSKKVFAAQLLKAYEGWQKKDIAADLKITPSKLSKILTAGQEVDAEVVISVSERRGCTTDWLLKGEGEDPVQVLNYLAPAVRVTIQKLADIEGREPEALIADLVSDALDGLAADMLRHRRSLRPKELRKLKALMHLLDVGDAVEELPKQVRTKAR